MKVVLSFAISRFSALSPLALASFQQIKVSSNAIQLFMFMRRFPLCAHFNEIKREETHAGLASKRLKSITKSSSGFKRNSESEQIMANIHFIHASNSILRKRIVFCGICSLSLTI